MNDGYKQSNTKKKEMANKMVKMHGQPVSKGGKGMSTTMSVHGNKGEKYRENGPGMEMTRGQHAKENGNRGMEKTKGMKAKMADTKGNFSSNFYSQHGKAKG